MDYLDAVYTQHPYLLLQSSTKEFTMPSSLFWRKSDMKAMWSTPLVFGQRVAQALLYQEELVGSSSEN